MLADPQVIKVMTVDQTLPRTLTGTDEGRFVNADNELDVQTTVQKNGRRRTIARFINKKITSDPLVSTTNVLVSDQITLTINRPVSGYSDADILDHVKGFIGWLTASTDTNLKKVIAGEN